MKLFLAPPSPYARRSHVLVLELGLQDRVEEVIAIPYDNGADLHATNPLGKIPALVDDDGRCWYDSAVINRLLLEKVPGSDLGRNGFANIEGMQIEALATGITDAAFWIVSENRRTDTDKPSAMWMTRWTSAIDRALPELNKLVDQFNGKFDLVAITVACALGYLDFRLPDIDWRSKAPDLANWYDDNIKDRASMQASRPDRPF